MATEYTKEPTKAVSERMSASTKRTTTGGGGGSVQPTPIAAIPAQEALPPPMSLAQIEGLYAPLRRDIETLPPPEPAPVPPQTRPLSAFLAVLGANLGASLLRNPGAAQQVTDFLIQKEQERKAVQAQNYARDLAFNQDKRMRLVQIRGQALETALKAALEANDAERAAKIAQNLSKLQAEVQVESIIPAAGAEELKQIEAQGKQARLTEETKAAAARTEEEKRAEKPLTTKEYLAARTAVMRNKQLDVEVERKFNFFGLKFGPRTGTPSEREEEAETIDVATIKNGEEVAKKGAKANLKRSILKRLGLLGKPAPEFTPTELQLLRDELAKYGLTPGDVQ